MQGNQQESAMGATTEGIHNPIRPINLNQRASPAAFTVTTRCVMAHRTPRPLTRCCDALTKVLSADMETVLGMARQRPLTQLEEKMGPAALLRRTLTTTAPTMALTRMRPRTNLQTGTQLMTGQNTSAPPARSTTTTVERRSLSGRSPRTCWRGNNDRKTQSRWRRTVSQGTWTTDKRPCRTKPQQRPHQGTSPQHPTLAIPPLPLLLRT